MSYDLYWVNDPYETERLTRIEQYAAVVVARLETEKETDLETELDRYLDAASGLFAIAAQDGAYFRASVGAMAAIRHELEHQGFPELAEAFVSNAGQIVKPHTLRHALTQIHDDPTMPADVSSSIDAWIDQVLPPEEAGVVIGREALLDAPSGIWQAKWEEFVCFLRSAADHGGVRVT